MSTYDVLKQKYGEGFSDKVLAEIVLYGNPTISNLMTPTEFIEIYGETEGLPHTKEEFDAWFKENARTGYEQLYGRK